MLLQLRILLAAQFLLPLAFALVGLGNAHAQAVPGQGTWQDTLQARDVGNTGTTNAFYDTVLGITWLRDANVNGLMNWNTANTWANNLEVSGVNGWRLPTATASGLAVCSNGGTNCGYNVPVSSSEMAHLFYETLGNVGYTSVNGTYPQVGYGLTNKGNFLALQSGPYWSGTSYSSGSNQAWLFDTNLGYQGVYGETTPMFALAVHPGDVGAVVASVPEPETYAMLLAGLGLIGAVARRRATDVSKT